MALLEDQIEEAQAAFLAAHEAKDTEGAQVLADHLRSLQAQKVTVDNAITESSQAGTDLKNPLIAGGVGALVGATVNPVRGAVHNIITPPVEPPKMSVPPPSSLSDQLGQGGENWTKSLTGVDVPNAQMNKGSLDTAQRMAQTVGRGGELAGGRITEGGIMLPPDIKAKPTAPAPRTIASQATQTGKNLLQGIAGEPQPTSPFSIVKGGARGAITGATLADIPQQLQQGNYGTATSDLGVAAGNIAHGLARTPKGKAIGTLLGLGSGILRGSQGINELNNPPEKKAEGGLMHLAGGGQPEFGEARAYEPSYSEQIRDYAAKHIGRERANRLFAGPNARVEDNFNPIAMAAQTPGVIADSAAGFLKAGQEGNYLEGMGHYLTGALNVAPMLKPAGQFAKKIIPKFAGGKSVVAEGAVDLAKKATGYLHHTKINPNPLVGTRFETKDLGGLAPVKDISLGDIRGHMLQTKPWDLTSRNKQIISVSGKPITTDIVTHGGQTYVRDLEHMDKDIGGASAFPISNRIQNITDISSREGEKLGGTGQVTMTPSTMSKFSEDYAIPTFDTYKNLWDQAEPGAARTQALLEKLRFASPKTLKTETPIPFAGVVKDVNYPFRDLKSLDFNDPDVAGRFMQTPDLRKALIKEWRSKENQKMMGYNAEDLSAAHTDPNLMGVPPAYAGHTMIEMRPGAKPTLSSNITYDTDFAGKYLGSVGHTPTPVLLNESYSKINNEMRQLHPNANEDALHRLTMGALYTRNEGVSDLVNDKMINRVGAYHEAVKQNKIDPNDVHGALQYLSKPGAYNAGGSVEAYAPGGKVGAAKKLFEEAQAAYKAKFTPDFVHFSPSNNIKAFDPSKAKKDPNYITPDVTFVAPMGNAKWANDNFLPVAGDVGQKEMYKTGSTGYPVSVNLGKHFDVSTPEGKQLINEFAAKFQNTKMTPDARASLNSVAPGYADYVLQESIMQHRKDLGTGNYSHLELPEFLQHLRDTGHNTFKVNESTNFGRGNVGIFNPADIRGKFAKFNPEDAADPDFMKAEGGPVQHFQAGKRVLSGGLEMLQNMIKAEGRTPVVPVPNRWFAQPEKFPNVQGMVNKTLENSQLPREAFHSGAFIDPRTGQILDKNIYNDVGVLIDPNTGRPMMSAGKESGIEMLDPKTGSYTKSNLVRQSLFKPTGGDPMLGEMPFIATIEKGDMGHKYALGTEYATPTEMYNTMTGANPTLRPRSRGDVFGMGDVIGQVQVGGRGQPHDVYEKLFVAPKGSDVPGVKLNKAAGGSIDGYAPGGKVGALANLAKFLEESKIPQRLYHGTTKSEENGAKALSQLKQSKEGSLGAGIYMTPNPDFAGQYAEQAGGYVMPLHANIKNPLVLKSTMGVNGNGDPMMLALTQLGLTPEKAEKIIEKAYDTRGYIGKEVMSRAQKQGYDGIAQYKDGDLSEVVSFSPYGIKSATGNTGDFAPYDPMLSKKRGGKIK